MSAIPAFAACLVVMPLLVPGVLRKMKARLQNRVGAPVLQPLFNFLKLVGKSEVLSIESTWLLRAAAAMNLAAMLVLACLVPWLSFKPALAGDDLFLVVYLFAFVRFFTMLSALDAGSAFGAFAAGREAVLSLLVEPAVVLSLGALALSMRTTSLSAIFSFDSPDGAASLPVWILAGLALFIASLVELSRMPVDDPTTHLELTMVHEAMTIENSGPNLALVELTYCLRLTVLYGLCGQCFLHAFNCLYGAGAFALACLSVAAPFALALLTALVETLSVKLKWGKNVDFIAYALTMALLAALAAVAGLGVL